MANQVLYGFYRLADIFNDRLTNVEGSVIADAIQQSVDEHNRQINAVMGLFADRTTDYTGRFLSPGTHRLQPLDENGRALPVKFAGHYDVAYPIRDAGSAWGANYKALAKMTVADANRITGEMLKADNLWMRDQLLAALFAAATYTYVDPQWGSLTIQPIANGDTVTYNRAGGAAAAVDTHQLFYNNAIADVTDPFPTWVTEITEHPENTGDVIFLVPTNLVSAIQALSAFHAVADPNITPGANSDTLNGSIGAALPGKLLGYHEAGGWVAEWKALPSNYVIGTTTQGERALKMREEPEAELQGFHLAGERDDHPYYERQWMRSAGFGAFNRVGAMVALVGSGSYSVPTGYTPPIS